MRRHGQCRRGDQPSGRRDRVHVWGHRLPVIIRHCVPCIRAEAILVAWEVCVQALGPEGVGTCQAMTRMTKLVFVQRSVE